jgi:hypothetical protein
LRVLEFNQTRWIRHGVKCSLFTTVGCCNDEGIKIINDACW